MFRKKEKLQSYINQVWRLFKVALVMMLVLAVVLGNRYLEADAKTTMSEQELDSSLLSLSEVYLPGTIYDKKDNVLMFGSEPGKLSWMSDKKSNSLERLIGGTDYIKAVETGNVRMTILGMAPELLGESDSRMDEKSLFHPNQRRIGGNVKLTIDADLQNFIEDLLIENGYMDSSVMVSNFQTGEVEAAVCLGGDSSETVFSRKFHPASTMKLAIAASALEYDANLANFSYTCKGNNTFTLDAEGKETVSVHCSGGNVHGTLTTMESAMAQSCNGYFIALAQQVPEEILRKNLKLENILQIPVSIAFGYFIDLTMYLFFWVDPQNYLLKIVALLIGCGVLGFGVYLEVVADVVMLPGESFVRAIVQTWNTNFGTTKIIFDTSMAVIAAALSFVFAGKLNGVREGTIIAALLVGFIARLLGKKLEFIKLFLFPEEYRNQEEIEEADETEAEQKSKNVIVIGR